MKQQSPPASVLSVAVVGALGLFCGYQVLVGLLTGDMTIVTRHAIQSFRWSSERGYYLAALALYSVVTAGAAWAVIHWLKRRKEG